VSGICAKPYDLPLPGAFVRATSNIMREIAEVGFTSTSIKLMDVPGPKLMDQEKFTLDMFYALYGYFAGARTARL
jgi:hypothetical protein